MTSGPNSNATPLPAKICVYCGSSPGNKPAYLKAAQELGRLMAENNISLGTLFVAFLSFYTDIGSLII